jgi:ATP-dependent Clp protease ATP-binding subunit ClpX
VARRALERRTGARGLRSIMEETLTPVMYTVPSDPTIVRVTITEECVTDGAAAQLTRDPERQLPAESSSAKKRGRKISAT